MRRGTALAVVGALILVAVPAVGSPVCPDEPRTACGDRIFPEPERAYSFIQHDNGEYLSG